MSTERLPEGPPASTKVTPGVWLIERPQRPNPFGVQWRERVWSAERKEEIDVKRTEFFSSTADRDRRRDAIFNNKKLGRANDLSREEIEEWRAFKAAAGGTPWRNIVAGFHAWLHQTGASRSGLNVEAWRALHIVNCEKRTNAAEMSADNFRHRKKVLENFAASFGHLALDQVKTEQVEVWIDSLGHKSAFTYNSFRKHLLAFFNEAVTREKITRNPIANLARRRAMIDNRTRILTPQQTAQLFEHALTTERFRPCLARLALEAFAGIRFTSAQRLGNDHINIADRGILLPAGQFKTGMETGVGHYIEGAPVQIWAWIKIAPASGWDLSEREYMRLKSLLFVAARVPHPRNCLRKSFCTFDLNAHRNPGRTAYLLGHTSQKLLWQTYKGNATHAESILYQSITPQTCGQIAQGEWPRGLNRPRRAPMRPGGST